MKLILQGDEKTRDEEFRKEHKHDCSLGYIRYIIRCGSIGNAITIKCELCDTEEDITDYSYW